VKLFAVVCFIGGVASLANLVIRRNRNLAWGGFDTFLTFTGIAGVMIGLFLLFNRMQ
jgi:hypothetical protein